MLWCVNYLYKKYNIWFEYNIADVCFFLLGELMFEKKECQNGLPMLFYYYGVGITNYLLILMSIYQE